MTIEPVSANDKEVKWTDYLNSKDFIADGSLKICASESDKLAYFLVWSPLNKLK